LLIVLGCLLIAIPTVQAHALLVRSLPEAGAELTAAPATIELWFSEPLEPQFSNIRRVDAQGNELVHGASLVDPADPMHMSLPLTELSPGIYTVVWRTLSGADGHEWVGSFPLTLLNPDGTRPARGIAPVVAAQRGQLPTPIEVVTRWLSLMGAIFLLGVLIFRTFVAHPLTVEQIDGTSTTSAAHFTAVVQRSVDSALFVGLDCRTSWRLVANACADAVARQFECAARSAFAHTHRQLDSLPPILYRVALAQPDRQRYPYTCWVGAPLGADCSDCLYTHAGCCCI